MPELPHRRIGTLRHPASMRYPEAMRHRPALLSLVFALSANGIAAHASMQPDEAGSRSASTRGSQVLCALLPHGKDRYWWGVSWGLADEADNRGIRIGIYEAGGYENHDVLLRQWEECRRRGADAYIVAAIQAHGLEAPLRLAAAEGRPVIDLINGIDSRPVTSHAVVSFRDMARLAAEHLLVDAANRPVTVAWMPGPRGAGWVADGDAAIRDVFAAQAQIRLAHLGHGPTDASAQAGLLRAYLRRHPMPDYVLGNAVAIEVAARMVEQQRPTQPPKLIAYYTTEPIVDLIREGKVLAAPTDSPVLQARIAVDLALRAARGESVPERASPSIEVLTRESLPNFDLRRLLPPDGQWMIRRPLPAGSN